MIHTIAPMPTIHSFLFSNFNHVQNLNPIIIITKPKNSGLSNGHECRPRNSDDAGEDDAGSDDGNTGSPFVFCWYWILGASACAVSKENKLLKNSYDAKKSAP